MKPDWVKYCEVYIDKDFNEMVVCIGCQKLDTVFRDMPSYWDHVKQIHWQPYNSSKSHTDFKKAAEASKLPTTDVGSNFIDLTETDDEGDGDNVGPDQNQEHELPLCDAKAEVKEEKKDLDEVEVQLGLIHGEVVQEVKQQLSQIYGEGNIASTQELQQELETSEAVIRACASIPTPEASPVENFNCAAAFVTTSMTTKATNQESAETESGIYGRLPSYSTNNMQPHPQASTSANRQANHVTVSIPLVQLPPPANESSRFTYAEYKRTLQQKQQENLANVRTQDWVSKHTLNQAPPNTNSNSTSNNPSSQNNNYGGNRVQTPTFAVPTTTSQQQLRVENSTNTSCFIQERAPYSQMTNSAQRNLNSSMPPLQQQQPQANSFMLKRKSILRQTIATTASSWQRQTQTAPQRRASCSQPMIQCQICRLKPWFKSVAKFEQHQNRFHNPQNPSEETFYCNVCERSFMKWCYQKHIGSAGHEKEKQRKIDASNPGGRKVRRRQSVAHHPYRHPYIE